MVFGSGKSISVIGNPGVGKTTFLLASVYYLDRIGWAEVKIEELPPNYGELVDLLVSGRPLSPTVSLRNYEFKFQEFNYQGAIVKAGLLGRVNVDITDLSGEDYIRTSAVFREAVEDAEAILLLLDPARRSTLAESLAGQVTPLVNAMSYIVNNERNVKYIGLVFSKRYLHNASYESMVRIIEEQLCPAINIARREKIRVNILEIDSRGKEGKLDPVGLEAVYYDALSELCKVKGTEIQVAGPMQEN